MLLTYYRHIDPEYVEATSIEDAKRIIERISSRSVDWDNTDFTEVDKDIFWSRNAPSETDSLSGNEPPHRILHQDVRKPLIVEKRVNIAGDKGRYVTPQTSRVRERTRD